MSGFICTQCGTRVQAAGYRGDLATEIVLWLLLVIGGIAYSIWRRLGPEHCCPVCGGACIPLASPMADRIVAAAPRRAPRPTDFDTIPTEAERPSTRP